MRSFVLSLLFVTGVIILAALLAPHAISLVEDAKLERMLRHIGRILLLIGMFAMFRILLVNNREALGYGQPRGDFLKSMAIGWLSGIAILGTLVLILMTTGVLVFDSGRPNDELINKVLYHLVSGALAGLLIGFFEETFFRGMVYSSVKRESGIISAVILSALLYSSMHFLITAKHPVGAALTWDSGLVLLPGIWQHVTTTGIMDSFFALFIAGIFLALVREFTGSIALAIGIHAGWVTVIKTTKYLTDNNHDSGLAWLVGNYDGITGIMGALLLLLLALPFITAIKIKKEESA